MIKSLVLIFSLLFGLAQARTLDEFTHELDWSIYSDVEIKEYFLKLNNEKRQRLLDNIKSAKLSLFNGNVQGAINILKLTQVKYIDTPLSPIIERYLALSYFTIGDFDKTLSILSKDIFLTKDYYHKVCVMRVASMLYLKRDLTLKIEMNRCQNNNIENTSTRFRWFKYLTDEYFDRIKNGVEKEDFYIRKVFSTKKFRTIDETRTWLKYVILFDLEEIAAEYFHFLPDASFQDDVLRTLMGFILYMANKDNKAKTFIEDLNNSNASYLKALLETKKEEFKTAYAHSISANKRRPFSINNVQLLSALSWNTQNWKIGRHTLNKVVPPKLYTREQKLFSTAFLVQEKNFYRAQREIEELYFLYNKKMPFEALVLESYIFLTIDDKRWVKSSDTACLRYDGMNCWLHMQSLIWEDYPSTIRGLATKRTKVLETIKKLTTKRAIPKIRESIFIRQNDILELDIAKDPFLEDVRILEP